MTGVLILAHGSRRNQTEDTMEKIAAYVKDELNNDNIEVAYMEFREVNLEKGLDKLAAKGADDIRVVPYFLFDGIHIKEDIPDEIAAYREKHPDIKISMGKTLGPDKRIAMVLADRIREAL